jgi:hypothetical protein
MREDGLTCSETMLETDTKAYLKFFNKIKESTQEATKKLEETRKTKNDKAAELRSINDEIQILVSNISKNIESLEVYNNYKVFLDQLSADKASKEENEEMDKLAHTKTLKKDGSSSEDDIAYQVELQPRIGKNEEYFSDE